MRRSKGFQHDQVLHGLKCESHACKHMRWMASRRQCYFSRLQSALHLHSTSLSMALSLQHAAQPLAGQHTSRDVCAVIGMPVSVLHIGYAAWHLRTLRAALLAALGRLCRGTLRAALLVALCRRCCGTRRRMHAWRELRCIWGQLLAGRVNKKLCALRHFAPHASSLQMALVQQASLCASSCALTRCNCRRSL